MVELMIKTGIRNVIRAFLINNISDIFGSFYSKWLRDYRRNTVYNADTNVTNVYVNEMKIIGPRTR